MKKLILCTKPFMLLLSKLAALARAFKLQFVLSLLSEFRHQDDLPSQALKIARQRQRGTVIGSRCRFLGRVDSVNPHQVEIGNKCVIGSESILLAHGPGFDGNKKTKVGSYVYIGYGVIVLPGIEIGDNSIIGAGSVVTKDIPQGKVAAGNPARILRDLKPEELADIRHRLDNDHYFSRHGHIQ